MTRNFQKVGIIGFVDKVLIRGTVGRLAKFFANAGIETYLEENTVDEAVLSEKGIEGVNYCSRQKMGENCDLVVVVGGDGSLLHAARDLVDFDIPILGVNRGRLGFLTDILPHELEDRVADVLKGNYVTTERFMFEAEVLRGDSIVDRGTALNDVILQASGSIRMVEFELHIDNQFVYTQRSDGLIISTPTGSTAYALSGGGPIVHPNLQAINLVPINPHTLSNRPILVGPDSELSVNILASNQVEALVVCDGQNYLDIQLGDTVLVRRKEKTITLLHPVEHDFYATCRTKLNWAQD